MTYQCDKCPDHFRSIHRLVTHRAIQHPLEPRSDEEVFARFELGRAK
jgi:hypothetical protein